MALICRNIQQYKVWIKKFWNSKFVIRTAGDAAGNAGSDAADCAAAGDTVSLGTVVIR
jgi:hypothetical protein